MEKAFQSPEEMERFLYKGFRGFEKLSDKEVQYWLNIYALGLEREDSVKVISTKIVDRETMETILVNNYTNQIRNFSDLDIAKTADRVLRGYFKLEGFEEYEEEPMPEPKIPGQPPFPIETGETDLDGPNVENDKIEEEGDDFDTDDVVWVKDPQEVDPDRNIMNLFSDDDIEKDGVVSKTAQTFERFPTTDLKS
jgi:hypothetical protein